MKPANSLLAANRHHHLHRHVGAGASQHGAINLGQGFPDTDGPADVVQAAADALLDGRNQYPPLTGVPELRQAVAAANQRFYGLDIDPDGEVVVTSGATEAITACLMALLDPGDEVVLIEPLYDTYLPVVTHAGRHAAAGAPDAAATGSCRAPNWPPPSGRAPRRSCSTRR